MTHTATPPEPAAAGGKRQRSPRVRRAGASLLAQGEPMVWLTGGSLFLALFMIGGLLTLIAYCGLPTFAALPLVRYETLDGNIYLGEVMVSESFPLTPAFDPPGVGPAFQQAKRAALGDATEIPARRNMLRIGNYELTQTHFQWVFDFEVGAAGRSLPEWALTVERREWGRFYGEPYAFVQRTVRTPGESEAQLARAIAFLRENATHLPAEQQPAAAQLSETLRAELAAERTRACANFLAGFSPGEGVRLEALLEERGAVPLAEVAAEHNVLEVREIWEGAEHAWRQFERHHGEASRRAAAIEHLKKHEIGEVDAEIEQARLNVRRAELADGLRLSDSLQEADGLQKQVAAWNADAARRLQPADWLIAKYGSQPAGNLARALKETLATQLEAGIQPQAKRLAVLREELSQAAGAARDAIDRYFAVEEETSRETEQLNERLAGLNNENHRHSLEMQIAWGPKERLSEATRKKSLALGEIVRAYPANRLTWAQKWHIYFSRWWEFLSEAPRESNSEGGVFPAIWGTIAMTLIMSVVVVPFGVLAALYLREYAKGGVIVSAVRIAINNLAGVPSIVFGVFGLGFFCYVTGAFLDGGPRTAFPESEPVSHAAWWLVVACLAICAVGAVLCTTFGYGGQRGTVSGWRLAARYGSWLLGLSTFALLVAVVFSVPYFSGFFQAKLPNPTYGKGALIWASLTLALLTLPVVIVSTEEALAAVPNSMREGSYACGASKWQTIWRIVLPHAVPGIMTGMILAMARGAGEVAPLMLVGVVKLAPELPVDLTFPFVHFDRSFMHLGFHIYDLGFQSQNSEAAKPIVFTTTLLLIGVIFTLNVAAIGLRNRLRRRYVGGQF